MYVDSTEYEINRDRVCQCQFENGISEPQLSADQTVYINANKR